MSNQNLANELHKRIIKKLQKRRVNSSFKDNIWSADLAKMQIISKFNKRNHFLLCVIDIFSKYAWVIPLKDKTGITINSVFPTVLNKSAFKTKKLWVNKGSELYNKSMKSWLEKNDIENGSTHNKEKSLVGERLIRTLKNKTYKHMTSISKNMYTDILDVMVNEYNNTYHRTIKVKPTDGKDNTYINTYDKDLKFQVSDHVRISRYKNIFAKGYTPNWSEEVFVMYSAIDICY